jgi:hypothetical protein
MGKVIDINRKSLEEKSELIHVNMEFSEDTVKMVEEWYPILENKGLVKTKTQTLTYLARLGSAFLNQYKQGKNIYIGEDKDNLKKTNILDFLRKL